jgi:hypothetical protein
VSLLKDLLRLQSIQAPQMAGGPQFGVSLIHQQVDWFLGHTHHEHPIVARELEGGTELASAIGVAPAAGERRLAHGAEAARKQGRRTCKRTSQQAQNVVRPQWVGTSS